MAKRKVRAAFIGTGGIAGRHLSSLKGFSDAEIVGLCDINREKLAARQEEFGGETFRDPGTMLDATAPDAVFICLPPFAHGDAELACIERKIPFLVEKPITNDFDLAKKIARKVKRADLLTCVGYMNRYRKAVQRAKKLLARRPASIIRGGWMGATPRNHPWLTQKRLSGGQPLEQTTHIFDLLRYLCGEAKSVFCFAARGFVPRSKLYNTDDASSVLIKMKSGAVATIMSSWSCGAGGGGVFLTIGGPEISVDLKGWSQDATLTVKGKEPESIPGEQNIFEIEDRAFVSAVKRGTPKGILSDYADGVRSLALTAAADESMKTGEAVRVRP